MLQQKILDVERSLLGQTVQREREVRACSLALLAQTPLMIIGPPGTAKTQVIRSMLAHFPDHRQFHTTMNEFMTVDEVCGPVPFDNIKKGQFNRKFIIHDDDGKVIGYYFPEAEFCLVDEWTRCTGPTAGGFITSINERYFFDGQRNIPVKFKFAAFICNHLPSSEEEFGALLDRMIGRISVDRISIEDTAVRKAILQGEVGVLTPKETVSRDEMDRMWAEVEAMEVQHEVYDALAEELVPGLYDINSSIFATTSDRRIHRGLSWAKALAWIEGADKVEKQHLVVYQDIVWNHPHEREHTDGLVHQVSGRNELMISGNTLPEEISAIVEENRQAMQAALANGNPIQGIRTAHKHSSAVLDDIHRDWSARVASFPDGELRLRRIEEAHRLITNNMAEAMNQVTGS